MEIKEYTLRDLLTIKNGKDYKHLDHGDVPVYGTGGIMTYVNEKLFSGESILLPRKGTLNNIIYVEGDLWTVDTMYWTIVDSTKTYPKYLYLYLSLLDLSSKDSGSTLPSMTFDSYYSIPVKLPGLRIQMQIADKIFTITNKILNNYNISKELESMAKTLYDYWFLQFEFPNKEGKPYKTSGGKMVWNDEFKREIPEGWEVNKISECLTHINTGLNPRDHFVLNDGNIKYVTVKNLTTTGDLDFSGCDTISDSTKKLINKRSMISPGDILFASIAPLGRCFIIRENPYDWEINESVFSIRPNEKVSSEYLYQYFMSEYFVKKAEHSSTGSVFAGIRISTLNDIDIVIPPKAITDKFTNKLINIYKLKYRKSKENQELTSLRDFLLPMLMNGQVTFK
ncbi:MAG: restriction endonuclease subunit S [Acholeplasmataceae bacterium]